MASMNKEEIYSDKTLRAAFNNFDKDKSGTIDKSEIKALLGCCDPDNIEKIMKQVDKDGDGAISYEEFAQMMK